MNPPRNLSVNSRNALRLVLLLTLAGYIAVAEYLAVPTTAQSSDDRFICALREGNSAIFLSCGGSAGNFIYTCEGPACTAAEGAFNQWMADRLCAEYAQEGCPPTNIDPGDGDGPTPVLSD